MSENLPLPQRHYSEAVPVGNVNEDFMARVEKYQGIKFQRIGEFDPILLQEMIEKIVEVDLLGGIEIFMTAKNRMHDGSTSGLIVMKYNREYIALAGLTDPYEGEEAAHV